MLFTPGCFKSAAGLELDWKIECDALDASDWACIAQVASRRVGPFSQVFGVPRGGFKLAEALWTYRDEASPNLLIVDDVWTTGKSLREFGNRIASEPFAWRGYVAFARGPLLPNVQCFARIELE